MPTLTLLRGLNALTAACQPGENVLDQLLRQGIQVDYSCKRGDCAQCVGTLIAGDVQACEPSRPLRKEGDIYLCNASIQGDATIRLPYSPETAQLKRIRSPAKIHELRRRSQDVIEVTLRLPPAAGFRFIPGQYIRVTNKWKATRSYSLATPPDSSNLLRLHVRLAPDGAFSQYLLEAQLGDLLHIEGPFGHFFVRDADNVASAIFLATGTGIAPIYAMLAGLSDGQRARLGAIRVYWGNRHRQDEYLRDALTALLGRFGAEYNPIFSREGAVTLGGGRHVQDAMASCHPDLQDSLVFACGASGMIDDARSRCLAMGLPSERFRADAFTAS